MRRYWPKSELILTLTIRKWSFRLDSNLFTIGLILRQAIQKSEYSISSTGWPDVRDLSKASILEYGLVRVLKSS